ncbi:MAG: hypothetical protein ACOX43_06560 [Bacilli bacterium]
MNKYVIIYGSSYIITNPNTGGRSFTFSKSKANKYFSVKEAVEHFAILEQNHIENWGGSPVDKARVRVLPEQNCPEEL